MNTQKMVNAVMAAILGTGVAVAATDVMAAAKPNVEKCYGIVKAKMNDCGTPQHACAGAAKTDGDPQEWIFLTKGNCTRIVGGSLTPEKAK
jgi:uncharacterized membrane protein